jgi:DNA-binding NtrC family response regulator
MNILIIDDDPGIRETLGVVLETMGYKVEMATSRTAAEKKRKKAFPQFRVRNKTFSKNAPLVPKTLSKNN